MSYLNKVWMAASVTVVNGHTEQGQKLRSGLKSLNHGKRRFSCAVSGVDAAVLRPLAGTLGSDLGGYLGSSGGGEERRNQTDESVKQVMYMNCWGLS